jgi:S-(hydroxymethyl)glutathione dehydrogenase / alcohol dehydrogenase
LESQCDNSNDNGDMGAYFGYSCTTGGYPGGQAEYLRVPFVNFTHFKIPETCEEPVEKFAVISDANTTGFWSVDNAGVKYGDFVLPLNEAKRGYEIFETKMDECIKVVLKP